MKEHGTTETRKDVTDPKTRGSKKPSNRSSKKTKPSKWQLSMRRGGQFHFGFVKCCPNWYAETTEKITSYFKVNGVKSKRQIARAIDVVMFVLRAQTTERCDETDWCLKVKNGEAASISYKWFTDFFHSKTACVRNLRLLRECGVLGVDHKWVHIPETDELKEKYGWKDWENSPTQNYSQGWIVNYKPQTEPCKWVEFPIRYDLNEFLEQLKETVESVGEIDAGNDNLKVYLDWDAIKEGLKSETLTLTQTLRDVGLCKKYAKREMWKNPPPRLNADGTPKPRQRRKTDEREYHAVAMVSKAFMSTVFTGKKGTELEGARMVEICDLHTGVIPSVLLADAVEGAGYAGLFSGHSRPTHRDIEPALKALEKLQSKRVKTLPDGSLTVTMDGDVYMDAVREIESRVKTDPVVGWYLGNFFTDAKTDRDKRELVKPFFLKTVYINDRSRKLKHKLASGHRMYSKKGKKFNSIFDAHVCTIFEDVLRREFPRFTDIVTTKYKTKWQKTELFDLMTKGEKLLTRHVSRSLKKTEKLECIRKHDALVTLLKKTEPSPSNSKNRTKEHNEQLVWNSVRYLS